MSTNACTFCVAGLACATKKVTYAFCCSLCKHWYAYGHGVEGVTIAIVNRSICKLPQAPQHGGYAPSRFEETTYGVYKEMCVDCAIKEDQKKRKEQALHEARRLQARDLTEFS